MFDYIHKQTGCELDWFTAPKNGFPPCTLVAQIRAHAKIMAQLQSITYSEIRDLTGRYQL